MRDIREYYGDYSRVLGDYRNVTPPEYLEDEESYYDEYEPEENVYEYDSGYERENGLW